MILYIGSYWIVVTFMYIDKYCLYSKCTYVYVTAIQNGMQYPQLLRSYGSVNHITHLYMYIRLHFHLPVALYLSLFSWILTRVTAKFPGNCDLGRGI